MHARSFFSLSFASLLMLYPQIAAADDARSSSLREDGPPSAAPGASPAPPPIAAPSVATPAPAVAPVTQHASPNDSVNEHGGEVARVPWTGRVGHGVGIGIAQGLWSSNFVQEVRFKIPVTEFFGVTVKGLMLHDNGFVDYHLDGGGRLELYGTSPIIAGFARMYGGGGVHVLTKIGGPGNEDAHLGGGGQFGFEFFLNPSLSWVLEVGGGSGIDGRATGGTAIAGMHVYPWSK